MWQFFYVNDASSILVCSTKKRYSSFFKKVFVFQKIIFKVKVLTKRKKNASSLIQITAKNKKTNSAEIKNLEYRRLTLKKNLLQPLTGNKNIFKVDLNKYFYVCLRWLHVCLLSCGDFFSQLLYVGTQQTFTSSKSAIEKLQKGVTS